VRVHPAHYHIDALGTPGVRSFEHDISFPHTGCRPEENLQLSPRLLCLFGLHTRQQGVGIRSLLTHMLLPYLNATVPIDFGDCAPGGQNALFILV
jgi:hypothetical protein